MKKYSEEELGRLKRQIKHKMEEIKKEELIVRSNKAKINEMKELGAEKDLYANETRDMEGAQARIDRWKELLKVDFEETIEMFNSKIEELNSKAKEMSKYLSKTPTARQIDATLKEEENIKLDEQIKQIEEKKQKKLNLMLNYQNMGDDDRVEEIKKDIEDFDKEIAGLDSKKQENQKIIDLNNSKQEDVKDILKEIAGIKKEIKAVEGLAEKCEVKLDIKEERKAEVVTAPEAAAPEVTAEEVTAPEAAAPEVTAEEVTAPEAAAPEVTAEEVTAPEAAAPEVTAEEVTAPEVAAPEVTAPEAAASEVQPTDSIVYPTIEKIHISPNGITIECDRMGEKFTQEVSMSDEDAEKIIEEGMIENDSVEYNRVDPNIIKALSGNFLQLTSYLSMCKLEPEEISQSLPTIEYNLKGIRKAKIDFEEKSFMYERAKATQKLLGKDNCSIDIGLLDRATLFFGKAYRTVQKSLSSVKNKLIPKKETGLLESSKEDKEIGKDGYPISVAHREFVAKQKEDAMKEKSVVTDLSDLTPEQKAQLRAEAEKMGYTMSDGEVTPKKKDEGTEIEF